jgi:hypothetical protein
MLDILPVEVLIIIGEKLHAKDTYNLLLVKKEITNHFGKEFLKKRFYYQKVQKLINNDFSTFKKEIILLDKKDLEKVFFYSLHNINTTWMNNSQGFFNMKYICECMILGCRIDDDAWEALNSTAKHFYVSFYNDLENVIYSLNENDREQIQKNIDNCRKLKSLHTDFIPFKKYSYI